MNKSLSLVLGMFLGLAPVNAENYVLKIQNFNKDKIQIMEFNKDFLVNNERFKKFSKEYKTKIKISEVLDEVSIKYGTFITILSYEGDAKSIEDKVCKEILKGGVKCKVYSFEQLRIIRELKDTFLRYHQKSINGDPGLIDVFFDPDKVYLIRDNYKSRNNRVISLSKSRT